MQYEDLKNEIIKIYKNKFPKSLCHVSVGCLQSTTIYIQLYLAENEKESINHIIDNDMLSIMLAIRTEKTTNRNIRDIDYSKEDLVLENCVSFYYVKPNNDFLAYSTKKIPFRKTRGDINKILLTFEKYVDKLHAQLEESLHNGEIHKNHIDLLEKKI